MDESPDSVEKALDGPVLGVEPCEDQGAVAQDGFVFQHDCVALLCLEMVKSDEVALIVCETHEDAVVVASDGSCELVSCKARSPSKPYTLATLMSEGGIRHLFRRWVETGCSARCRLMSDGALSDGRVKQFARDCDSGDASAISKWAEELTNTLDGEQSQVEEFLRRLTLQCEGLAPRAQLAVIFSYQLVRPLLRTASMDPEDAMPAYQSLTSEIARRSRAASSDPWLGYPLVEAARAAADGKRRARILARALSPALVRERIFGEHEERRPPALAGDPDGLDQSILEAKLLSGEAAPALIAAAKRLRASWFELEEARRLRAPGSGSGFEDLRTRALLVIADAEATFECAGPYATRLYEELRKTLTPDAVRGSRVSGLSSELLLGLVFQLTDECEVYWSSDFRLEGA